MFQTILDKNKLLIKIINKKINKGENENYVKC